MEKNFFRKLDEEFSIDFFKTSDFYLAAFLVAKNLKIKSSHWLDFDRLEFIFEDSEDRQDLVRSFILGEAEIKVRAFINAIRFLREFIRYQKLLSGNQVNKI